MKVTFDVEQAGCESCGKVISTALADIGTVESIEIDEAADSATVVLSGEASPGAVDGALERASADAGHEYRIRVGSWQPLA